MQLEKVPYKFTIKLDDSLEEITENSFDYDKNMQKTLDLKQILWQNIVLEVPISYTVCKDANLKGVGWEFKSANVKSKEEKEEIDPRLKKLEDLLKGDD